MSLTRELLDFEASVVSFGRRMDQHMQCLVWAAQIDGEDELPPEFENIRKDMEREIQDLRIEYRKTAGDILLRAVEVSKRCIEVENEFLRKQ